MVRLSVSVRGDGYLRIAFRGSPVAGHRRALVVGCAGNAVEWYDFALFGGTAGILAKVLAPGGWGRFIAVFATLCLFRPLGSLMTSSPADWTGRRPVLAAGILLLAFTTFCIGLLPPWSVIGLTAPSTGGEVSMASLTEVSPPDNRGRTGGWYLNTVTVGGALELGITALIAAVLDPQGLLAWGWRIPVPLALASGVVGVYMRRRAAESPLFAPAQQRGPPRAGGACCINRRSDGARSNVWRRNGCSAAHGWGVGIPGFGSNDHSHSAAAVAGSSDFRCRRRRRGSASSGRVRRLSIPPRSSPSWSAAIAARTDNSTV
jgi:MFS family permease